MRLIRIIATANLFLAMAVGAGYLIYGLAFHLPVNDKFLGVGRSSRHGPPWFGFMFMEVVILGLFLFREAPGKEKYLRVFCAVLGTGGLISTVILPYLRAQIYDPWVITPDTVLGWYIWCSPLPYGLVGGNNEERVPPYHLD